MTALDNTPTNHNFLSPLNFTFQIKRSPYLNFFIQSINIPGVNLGYPIQTNPFTNIPITGDRLHFEDLTVTFKVDENLQNYLEIYNWLSEIGFPESFTQYAGVAGQSKTSGNSIYSDLSLIISDARKVPNFLVTFRDAFPIALGPLNFEYTDTSVEYITSTVTFRYIFFQFEKFK